MEIPLPKPHECHADMGNHQADAVRRVELQPQPLPESEYRYPFQRQSNSQPHATNLPQLPEGSERRSPCNCSSFCKDVLGRDCLNFASIVGLKPSCNLG